MLGPGDVVGINPRAIVKTEPRNWVTDFESNYLPYIEFYEEDFPWRFTPARAASELDAKPPASVDLPGRPEGRRVRRAEGRRTAVRVWLKEELDPSRSFPTRADLGLGARAREPEHHRRRAADDRTEPEVRGVEQNLADTLAAIPTLRRRACCARGS